MKQNIDICELERLCLRCGKCRSVCPSFAVRLDETDTPRGRIVLATALACNQLRLEKEMQAALEDCLGCGACAAICPSGAAADRLSNLAKMSIVNTRGLPLIKRLILRGLLRHGRLLGHGSEWSARIWTLTLQNSPKRSPLRKLLPLAGMNPVRHLSRPSKHQLYRNLPEVTESRGKTIGTVTFFPGCGLRLIYPDTARNAIKLLSDAGYRVLSPPLPICCGRPALAHGDISTFNYLSRRLATRLRETGHPVVVACASCALTLARVYKEQGIEDLPQILEFSQALAQSDVKWKPTSSASLPLTYHDPCHLRHGLGVTKEPRQLLIQAYGEEYVELDNAGSCCGGAGSFHLSHFDVARELGNRKASDILQSGAQMVVTSCPGCMMFLEEMARIETKPWQVSHLADVLKLDD